MRMKRIYLTIILMLCGVILCGCQSGSSQNCATNELSQRTKLGLSWMQNSAEYRALCYQTYNAAYAHIKQASSEKTAKPKAIILDLDETILDNSEGTAAIFEVSKNQSDYNNNLTDWLNYGKAKAIPGAVDFLRNVEKLGVEIFYVSNRSCKQSDSTKKNLKVLKYPTKNRIKCRSNSSNKKLRFEKIANNYTVLAYFGDNANDFPINLYGVSSKERNTTIDKNASLFGVKYFILPNPVYGDWVLQINPDFYRNSFDEKVDNIDSSVTSHKKFIEHLKK